MVGNKLYAAGIVLFWLAAMTYLVVDRILPPWGGDPAPISRIVRQQEPLAWRVAVDGHPVGVAVLQAVPTPVGSTDVLSTLELDRVPAPKSPPIWLAPLVKSIGDVGVSLDTCSRFDAFGSLVSFDTSLQITDYAQQIRLSGAVKGDKLVLRVRLGDITKRFEQPWSATASLASEFGPEPRILPVYAGRVWRHEVYSPLSPPGKPVEVLEARVTDSVRHDFDGRTSNAWIVEYRSTEKTGRSEEGRLRAQLRVAEDGRVLQQEARLFGTLLTLTRLPDEESQRLADEKLETARYARSRGKPDAIAVKPTGGHVAGGSVD
ncbi:MAG: hypothetical protein AAF805_04790 [Planctomycetota bacterium]